jgi:hypothetical protein
LGGSDQGKDASLRLYYELEEAKTMSTLTEAAGEIEAISRVGSTDPTTIGTRLANFLLVAMIVFGAVLSALWTAGLLWMALVLVLLIV